MPVPNRIMIVEDEVIIALSMEIELTRAGFSVCATATRGDEAVTLAKEVQPDLVLMDIGLPGDMDGFTAAQQIKSSQNIPIIFLSGYMDEATTAQAKQISALDCLGKPISMDQLKMILEEMP